MVNWFLFAGLGVGVIVGWFFVNHLRKLEKRVDFLTLLMAATTLDNKSTGDGEKDYQILIDKMDAVFGRPKE